MANLGSLLLTAERVYRGKHLPRPFLLLQAASRIHEGAEASILATDLQSTHKHLEAIASAVDPCARVFGHSIEELPPQARRDARRNLGQLMLGKLAERLFQQMYKEVLGNAELSLLDHRSSRSDTDFRVHNGSGRPVFRLNIKFSGTQFERASELVGLAPDDCFPLATYKIHSALLKQIQETLPYIFLVIQSLGLTGDVVGAEIPDEYVSLMALVRTSKIDGKRGVEDAVVDFLVGSDELSAPISRFAAQMREAEWRVLSARRAYNLLRDLLFNRVYAVRVRSFARVFNRAEVDMHFSVTTELTPLRTFLIELKERGLHWVAASMERGDI